MVLEMCMRNSVIALNVFCFLSSLPSPPSPRTCSGGLESKGQEAALRNHPDVVIATPGRLVDHLLNAPGFSLQTVEILVLDEADR